MRSYDMGNPELDDAIADLVGRASANGNSDLIAEIITTALKLHRDSPDRGELKLVNTALKEMRYSMLVFSRHRSRPKVTMYGSARTPEDDPEYLLAMEFARIMAEERDWDVLTGAGPGVMEAGNRGAGLEASFGVNIRLPFEGDANAHISPDKLINFKYFFTRKLGFVKESSAFALFPGGFGTMDEAFELLTLIQTGKSDMHPIVLIQPEGSDYWDAWDHFVIEQLVGRGMISPEDRGLYSITSDPHEAADQICNFYANYQSQRYVDGKLVLRLNQAPRPEQVADLNDEFSDIVAKGDIAVMDPTDPELRDNDSVESARIGFVFNRRHFGRLRLLIDRLNSWVETPVTARPGAAFTDEQQERPW